MSRGRVRQVTWEYGGQTWKAWGHTVTLAEGCIRKSGYLTKAEAQEALFLAGGREERGRCNPPKSVQKSIGESLIQRRC
jgi:hypothetical protein